MVFPDRERLRETFAKAFATPHLAEYGLSLHAIGWGLAQLITLGMTFSPIKDGAPIYTPRLFEEFIGLWPLMTGIIGLWAVSTRNRYWRMSSSIAIMPLWIMLAIFYLAYEPPLAGSIVTYAVVGAGELVVWVRVKYRFDRWAEALR
jgi:hypothetical protein